MASKEEEMFDQVGKFLRDIMFGPTLENIGRIKNGDEDDLYKLKKERGTSALRLTIVSVLVCSLAVGSFFVEVTFINNLALSLILSYMAFIVAQIAGFYVAMPLVVKMARKDIAWKEI